MRSSRPLLTIAALMLVPACAGRAAGLWELTRIDETTFPSSETYTHRTNFWSKDRSASLEIDEDVDWAMLNWTVTTTYSDGYAETYEDGYGGTMAYQRRPLRSRHYDLDMDNGYDILWFDCVVSHDELRCREESEGTHWTFGRLDAP